MPDALSSKTGEAHIALLALPSMRLQLRRHSEQCRHVALHHKLHEIHSRLVHGGVHL